MTFDGGSDAPDYSYFNVPDSVKDDGSYPWNKNDFPACTATDDCIICSQAKKLSDIYALPDELKKLIDNGKNATAYFYLDVPDGADVSSVNEQLTDITEQLISGASNLGSTPVVVTEDGKRACFGVTYTSFSDIDIDEDDENALNIDYSKLIQKMKEKLGSSFMSDLGSMTGF